MTEHRLALFLDDSRPADPLKRISNMMATRKSLSLFRLVILFGLLDARHLAVRWFHRWVPRLRGSAAV
jgi:hypothetical protein